jgi:hypothetical protein
VSTIADAGLSLGPPIPESPSQEKCQGDEGLWMEIHQCMLGCGSDQKQLPKRPDFKSQSHQFEQPVYGSELYRLFGTANIVNVV